jgi:uncharacterized protein involved in exopolysaccharide biosynthesis
MAVGNETPADEIRFLDLWRAVSGNRVVFAICVLVFAAASAVIAYTSPIVYRSDTTLMLATSLEGTGTSKLSGAVGSLASLVSGAPISDDASRMEEALAVMRSRAFTLRFIEEEKLMPVLFADRWDAQAKRWLPDKRAPTASDAYNLFDKRVRRIEEDTGSGLVRLFVEWTDPELAARWANLLIDRLNEQMRQRAIKDAEQSLDYLNRQAPEISSVAVQQVLYGLVETQLKQSMLAHVQKQFVFKVLDPAVVSDPGRFVKPRRMYIIFSGLVLGGIVGVAVAFVLSRRRRSPA